MKKLKFTFLTQKQAVGKRSYHKDFYPKYIKGRLAIFNKVGADAKMTDYSKLLGGISGWWTQTIDGRLVITADYGRRSLSNAKNVGRGARPAVSYRLIASNSKNEVRGEEGVLEVEYGEYPQTIVPDDLSTQLESAFSNKTINKTGKQYTFYDGRPKNAILMSLDLHKLEEYEYNGKKYVRFVVGTFGNGRYLSDSRSIKKGEVYWVEVEPIKWLVDEKANIAVSKNLIFSGMPFDTFGQTFESSLIKKFMDEYFSKEIIPVRSSEVVLDTDLKTKNPTPEKNNKPYAFTFKKDSSSGIVTNTENNSLRKRR